MNWQNVEQIVAYFEIDSSPDDIQEIKKALKKRMSKLHPDNNNQQSQTKKQKERYVRWQNYRITQLSFSINLFLGFAVASLAYVINLKLGENPKNPEILVSIIKWWSWSAALGCLATITRLLDFRYTARKIKDGGDFNAFMAKYLGPVTWSLFWVQLFTYVGGAYYFISSIVSA